MTRGRLSIVVCGAGPAAQVDRFVKEAHDRGWEVQVIATPACLAFIDVEELEALSGNPVRHEYREPGEPRSEPVDAIVVAPATYNTINKLAAGISDTYALGVIGEAIGQGLPVVIVPFVNTALAARQPYQRSIKELAAESVDVLHGPGAIEPHEPHTGGALIDGFPWKLALDRLG